MPLDLSADVVDLTEQLVNIESVSHQEQEIADAGQAVAGVNPRAGAHFFRATQTCSLPYAGGLPK